MRVFFALGVLSLCLPLSNPIQAQPTVFPEALHANQSANAPLEQRIQVLANKVKNQLVYLPGGTFEMGDWGNEEGLHYDMKAHSRPLHQVSLDGFHMMIYKVTYDDFDVFTDAVGEARVGLDWLSIEYRSARRPAGVSWYGAKAYCLWLGGILNAPFDLPTEAQWEYAARSGGQKILFATDNGHIDKDRNFPWDVWHLKTPEIGSYPPNQAGIYGMLDHGASEWVNDWYDPEYYKHSPLVNPKGPDAGQPANSKKPEYGPAKVMRGHESPGSSPIFGGFVFSRRAKEPTPIRNVKGPGSSKYSYSPSLQFRCVKGQSLSGS